MSKLKRVAPGIYRSQCGTFFLRGSDGPTNRYCIKLEAKTLTEAMREAEATQYVAPDPSFRSLANQWQQAGCPDAHNQPQSASYCERQAYLLTKPLAYFKDATAIPPMLVDDYHAWRSKLITREGASGRRITDLELTACSSLYRWAYRRGLVKANPFLGRGVRQKEGLVVHCTARAPMDADIVHKLGAKLLSVPSSESCGFLWLFLCLTGCRCQELRELRLDGIATGNLLVPGSYTPTTIVIRRAKMRDRDGAIQPIPLQPAAQALLPAWERWHQHRHPGNPYWFPGLRGGPLDQGSLAHALKRVCRQLALPNIQPHGARSYFCKVMRSLLPDDRQVADLLGHSSTLLVQRLYGKRTPTEGLQLSFLPTNGKPAWEIWSPKPACVDNLVPMPQQTQA